MRNENQDFESLNKPISIKEQEWDKNTKPLVSISCITYNHENYLKDAIEGFLNQKTTFPVEIIIHDDSSTDDTCKIIKEYETKYPGLVTAIYQNKNQYSQGIKPFYAFVLPKCIGRYIALCEGDDYWIDDLKLQKQFEFMDTNKEYSMCFHRYKKRNGNSYTESKANYQSNYVLKDVAEKLPSIQTATVFFKNDLENQYPYEYFKKSTGSRFLFLYLAKQGKIGFINEFMSVYRVHENGIWTGKSKLNKFIMSLRNMEVMIEYTRENRNISNILKVNYVKKSYSYIRKLKMQDKIKLFQNLDKGTLLEVLMKRYLIK